MKKIALLLVLTFALFSPKAFGAESDLTVSLDTINFGHEGTEKTLYLTNKGAGDFFWSAKTDAPWLAVEPALGKIDNPQRLPANAPYQFSNMWPKLPQPWYFRYITNIGIDHKGNIYILDWYARRIKKFNQYEEFLFEVGNSNSRAEDYLDYPIAIAFDAENNFYVSTSEGGIKKFSGNGGFLRTIKKNTQEKAYYGYIAIDSKGNIYTTDTGNHCVNKFDREGNYLKSWGEEGPDDGKFLRNLSIVIDSGDYIYIADNHHQRIQKFDSEGNFIKKWGNSTYGEDWQLGDVFTIDTQDNIYICHEHSAQIYKFNTELNQISFEWKDKRRWSGNFYMNNAAVARDGTIYLVGEFTNQWRGGWWKGDNHRLIIKFDSQGNEIGQWKSWDIEKDNTFYRPKDIVVDNAGKFYIIDYSNRLRTFDSNIQLIKKCDFSKIGLDSSFLDAITVDRDSNVYISIGNKSIAKFDPQGNLLAKWTNDIFASVGGLAVDSKGSIYALINTSGLDIFFVKLDAAGNIIKECKDNIIGEPTGNNYGIVVDSRDNVYAANVQSREILKFDTEGNLVTRWRVFIDNVSYESDVNGIKLAIDRGDNIYASSMFNKVQKYDSSGNLLSSWGEYGCLEGQIAGPRAIAVDRHNNIYIADTENDRIQVFSQAVQPVKVSLDRSKLPARTNEARLELYNDANASQAAVGVGVLAYGPNHAPELALMGNKTVDEGRLLEFTISATDIDSDTLTYSATGLPQGAKFDPATRRFSWAPSKTQSGSYQVTFNVSDGELSSSKTANITVNDIPNQPPMAQISAKPISGRSPLKVKFSADKSNDPDGSVKWYLWEFGDGSTSSKKNPEHTFSHSLKKDVTYKVVLTVIDDGGAQSSVEKTIVVSPKKKQSWWSKLWPF